METGRQLANLVAKFGLYYESDRTQLVRLFYDMADQAHEDCDNVTLSHKREAKLRRALEEGKSIEEVTKIYDKFGH